MKDSRRAFRPPARWKRMAAWPLWFFFRLATWIVPPPRGLRQTRLARRVSVLVWSNAYWWYERAKGRV